MFRISESGEISERQFVAVKLNFPEGFSGGKIQLRPFVADWNGDGNNDVILILGGYEQLSTDHYADHRFQIYVNTKWHDGFSDRIAGGEIISLRDPLIPTFDFVDLGSESPLRPPPAAFQCETKYWPGPNFVFEFSDFDRDGDLDIFMASGGRVFFIERNSDTSKTSFKKPRVIFEFTDQTVSLLNVVDFNGDRKLSLVVTTDSGLQKLAPVD